MSTALAVQQSAFIARFCLIWCNFTNLLHMKGKMPSAETLLGILGWYQHAMLRDQQGAVTVAIASRVQQRAIPCSCFPADQ